MTLARELRYYASVPKVLLLLLVMVGLAALGWYTLMTGFSAILAWLLLLSGCSLSIVALVWLFFSAVMRQPILRVNAAGLTSASPLRPRRRRFVSWENTVNIRIGVQRLSSTATNYYLIVDALNPPETSASPLERASVSMYPSLARAAITVTLNWFFVRTSRKRRAQLLERIKTTFAPEISRYGIVVDEQERPL